MSALERCTLGRLYGRHTAPEILALKQPEQWRHFCLQIEREVMVRLAGPLAEARYRKIRGSGLVWIGDERGEDNPANDLFMARTFLGWTLAAQRGHKKPTEDDLFGRENNMMLEIVQHRTRRLLWQKPVWTAVQRLAAKLVKLGHVDRESAEAIFKAAGVRQISMKSWVGPAS